MGQSRTAVFMQASADSTQTDTTHEPKSLSNAVWRRVLAPGCGCFIPVANESDYPNYDGHVEGCPHSSDNDVAKAPRRESIGQIPDHAAQVSHVPSRAITAWSLMNFRSKLPDVSSMAKLPDVSSMAKLPDVSSMAKLPDVSSMAKLPDVSSMVKLPDVSSMVRIPDYSSMVKLPDVSSMVRIPDYSSMVKLPDVSSMVRIPDYSSMVKLPDVSSMVRIPDYSSMVKLPDVSSMVRIPDYSSSMVRIPDYGSMIRLPSFVVDFDLEPLKRALKLRRVPENWLDVDMDADDVADAIHSVLDEGIPLGWVPSGRVVQLLLTAPDSRVRRRVISNNFRGILNDCERVCRTLPAPGALFFSDKIRRSVTALRDGHEEAAQALATNVLDTLVEQHARSALGVGPGALTNPSYRASLSKRGWRLALSLRPLPTVMSGRYGLDYREPGFRRNATTHAITRYQYNRINAVIAIMLATSLLACFVRDTPVFD